MKELGLDDILDFGKYKGEKISEVLLKDAQYIEWCMWNIPTFILSNEVQKMLVKQLEYDEEVKRQRRIGYIDEFDYLFNEPYYGN